MPRWTLEARAAQAAKIRRWQPWRESTGPKTKAGKAICQMNRAKKRPESGKNDAETAKMLLDLMRIWERLDRR